MNIVDGNIIGNTLYYNYEGYEIELDHMSPQGRLYFYNATHITCHPNELENAKLWIDNAEKEKLRFQYNEEFHNKLKDILDV